MLARLWSAPEILPMHIHSKLDDKASFGLHPVGTGPYKLQSYEPASGNIVLVKNPDYNWGGYEPSGKIGRIEVSTIPDAQTRMAKMMVGDLDLIFNVDYTQAKEMVAANPSDKIVLAPTVSFSYILFDTADRSGIHVFKDKRVREALLRAINIKGIRDALLPPEYAAKPPMQAMCHPEHVACTWSEAPVSYDPAKAKELLEGSGCRRRLRGADLDLGPGQGQRRSGRRRSPEDRHPRIGQCDDDQRVPDGARRRQDRLQVTQWDNGGGAPDVDTTAQFFYAPSTRNYINDPSSRNSPPMAAASSTRKSARRSTRSSSTR